MLTETESVIAALETAAGRSYQVADRAIGIKCLDQVYKLGILRKRNLFQKIRDWLFR